MYTVKAYTPADHQAWEDFVQAHPESTLFHTRTWQDVVHSTFGHQEFSLLLQNNAHSSLAGVLPLFRIKSLLFGDFLLSTPFAELGGALALDQTAEQELAQGAKSLAAELDLEYVELRNQDPLPGLPSKDLYYNFQREIDPDLDKNLQAIPRKSRRMVRQGIKNNLQAEEGGDLLPLFYDLLCRNFHRLGTPIFPYSWFSNLLQAFADQAHLLMVRTEQGQPIAGVLSFFYQDTVMPYYAGSLSEYRNLAPNDFMYWKLLERAWELGYTNFDFGRSKQDTGSYSFKKHWGFEPRPLAYQYILHKKAELPDISPKNPKYQKKIELWRKMPLGLTKILGPRISKYLC